MNRDLTQWTRREFLRNTGLVAAGTVFLQGEVMASEPDLLPRLRTPHKFPQLVVEASYKKDIFDALAVDAPFVFRHKKRNYSIISPA